MSYTKIIKINFRGGIISPGELLNILAAAEQCFIKDVSFGLRQQLFLEVDIELEFRLITALAALNIAYEVDADNYPNVMSSYPAEEVFINNTWLSEGVYKDIFDLLDYEPKLKINISDSNQSFTPLLTGNINWVAAPGSSHFWYLFIRFPKTNTIFEWEELVYTNDVAKVSKQIERLIFKNKELFYDQATANGNALFELLGKENFNTQKAAFPAKLPAFNLPYYEGLNKYYDKYWLGIYRRDEMFSIEFLKDLCHLSLKTKLGQICATPWKTLMVKSIEEKDRPSWNALLEKHKINVRHAANELNFQVEDACKEALALKYYLLKNLHLEDMRTYGICIGIKTKKKTEVFSSILVRRRTILRIGKYSLFNVYDILCAKDFNPNERTGFVYSMGNPKFLLGEQLRRAIFSFYSHQLSNANVVTVKKPIEIAPKTKEETYVHQCQHCLSVYDENELSESLKIFPFEDLPIDYCCPLCEAPKTDFLLVGRLQLGLQVE